MRHGVLKSGEKVFMVSKGGHRMAVLIRKGKKQLFAQ